MTIAIMLHIVAAVIWVGGMFFVIMVLRRAAGALEPAPRLALWGLVFARFFPWVWAAIAVLILSGYWMVIMRLGGHDDLPLHLHLMQGLGWLMVLLYLHLWFAPYRRFKTALAGGEPTEAARNLNQIRKIVTTNMVLGLIVVVVGASGRFWG